MSAETACLRCGGAQLISAHLEHPIAFCMDHETHHGVQHLGIKAALCQDCGHVEFFVPDPSQIVKRRESEGIVVLQEEDF
ncbi:MAG: hypothetical protein JO250_15960 [Armatimonadetes bacterium]|nr:hypothetical protein [Armatimonadota bacterium]